eukprot:gene18731-22368_t
MFSRLEPTARLRAGIGQFTGPRVEALKLQLSTSLRLLNGLLSSQVELRGATLGAAESRRALASCVPQEFVAHGATRGARTSALCLFTRSFSESSKDRTTRSQGRRAGAGAWGAEAPTGEKKAENVPPHRDYRDARSGRVVMHKVPKALQALQVNELLTREQRLKEARNIEADLHAARRDLDHKSRARFIALYVDVGDVAAARRLVTECTATGKE